MILGLIFECSILYHAAFEPDLLEICRPDFVGQNVSSVFVKVA
jgi:hypothetical protein